MIVLLLLCSSIHLGTTVNLMRKWAKRQEGVFTPIHTGQSHMIVLELSPFTVQLDSLRDDCELDPKVVFTPMHTEQSHMIVFELSPFAVQLDSFWDDCESDAEVGEAARGGAEARERRAEPGDVRRGRGAAVADQLVVPIQNTARPGVQGGGDTFSPDINNINGL
jgi:hypothetical protein